jgi:hypothetical protein
MKSVKTFIQRKSKQLKDAWKNRHMIWKALKHYISKDEHIERLAKTRMSICAECPLLDLKGTKCFVPGTQPCCGDCGCSLKLKTRSIESECPQGKW